MTALQELRDRMMRVENGVQDFIPNPHTRMRSVFNMAKATYSLIGSVTGVGKTSFVDDTYVLRPFIWYRDQDDSDIHFEGIYWSMERKRVVKTAKWSSWMLFEEKKEKIPYDLLLGTKLDLKAKLDAKGYPVIQKLSARQKKLLASNEKLMEHLFEVIDVQDGIKTVAQMEKQIEQKAFQLGNYFHTDGEFLYHNNKKQSLSFIDKGRWKSTRRGKVVVIDFAFKGKNYELTQNSRLYIPKKPNTFVFLITDHIGKISIFPYKSKKLAIDAYDAVMSEARDKFGFSPIAISQFNRDVSNIARIKDSKGKLEPLMEDFKDTGNPAESADFVGSLFDPYRYSSYDSNGRYKGYSISQGTLSPIGGQRFRSFHVLKNSYGPAQIAYGMRFTGEIMRTDLLPLPDDPKLAAIYADIAAGH